VSPTTSGPLLVLVPHNMAMAHVPTLGITVVSARQLMSSRATRKIGAIDSSHILPRPANILAEHF